MILVSLAKLDTVTSQVSNYAGGENVGASWTDKVMSMKSHDSPQPADDGAGADEDEWVRLVDKHLGDVKTNISLPFCFSIVMTPSSLILVAG